MKLGDIAKVGAGQGAPQGPHWFTREGSPFIRAANLDSLCADGHYGSLERVSAAAAAKYRLRLYPQNTIIFPKSGMSATKNRVFMLTEPAYVVNHLATLEPSSQVSPTYFRYWLESFNPSRLIKDPSYPSISQEDIEQVDIQLPSVAHQNEIVEQLSLAERLRRTSRYALQTCDELLPTAFLQIFGEPIRNERGWPVEQLGDLGEVSTGGTPPSSKQGMFGTLVPFITPADLEANTINATRFLSKTGAEYVGTARPGSTLVCCIGATIGKTDIARVRSAYNQQINAVEWNGAVNDAYGVQLMRFFSKIVAARGHSTTLPILKKSAFEEIGVPVPPLPLQLSFAKITEFYEQLRATHVEALRQADHVFQTLLHQAFSA